MPMAFRHVAGQSIQEVGEAAALIAAAGSFPLRAGLAW
jgi:hypothetical protein